MIERYLREFRLAHADGVATVVGKGPTTYDYAQLAAEPGIVMFINDAVQFEDRLRPDQISYVMFLDPCQRALLHRNTRSTVICPKELIRQAGKPNHDSISGAGFGRDERPVLELNRDRIAETGNLHCDVGTCCPLLHFLYYAGIRHVRFIGCDGINDRWALPVGAYDERLADLAGGKPGWNSSQIRLRQDQLCAKLKLTTEYVGTPDFPPLPPPLFITAATPSYAGRLACLKQSATAVGVPLFVEDLQDRGRWELNCGQKPEVIARLREKFPGTPIVWVDADAVFRAPPLLLLNLPRHVDVACGWRASRQELVSSVLYFGPTVVADRVLQHWVAQQSGHATIWDQVNLATSLKELKVEAVHLPPEYCFIFDISRREHPEVTHIVIEQFQHSRVARHQKEPL